MVDRQSDDPLSGCDCLVVSPGVPMDHAIIRSAVTRGLPVTGELEIAYTFSSSRIIGVTGTNGKSTVVSMIGDILDTAEVAHTVAGNIGTPFSDVVDDAGDVTVLEISSFQLDTIDDFKCDVAVLLNITPDHLDRYDESMDNYAASKARILNRADSSTYFVYNADDRACVRIAGAHAGPKIAFSSSQILDRGIYSDGAAIVRRLGPSADTVLPLDDFPPVGIHNLENAMAAIGSVVAFDIDDRSIRSALSGYTPLPHRMEIVRVLDDVTYINDSKATNVDATSKSVRSIEGPVILILGGLDKSGDFGVLAGLGDRIKHVVLIGDAAAKIRAALTGHIEMSDAGDMQDAVASARRLSSPGDTVLLAPACASFDMFKNYQERGEVFRAAVNGL